MVRSFFRFALIFLTATSVPLLSATPVSTSNPGSRDFELILPGIYRLQDAANVYLLKSGNSEIGFNPYWATFYPAKSHVRPGGDVQIFLRIINVVDQGIPCRIILKGPEDIIFGEKVVETLIGPGETAEIPVRMHVRKKGRVGTHLVTADIEYGNEIFGALPVGYLVTDE